MIDAEATKRFMAAPWLAEVDPETKRAICGALVEARAPTGATLLEQGQPNDHLTFLIEGTAEIVRIFGTGRRDVITQLTAPAVFGTTSFFQPKAADGYGARPPRRSGFYRSIILLTRHCARPTPALPKRSPWRSYVPCRNGST